MKEKTKKEIVSFGVSTVPAGSLFLMGDNRLVSYDTKKYTVPVFGCTVLKITKDYL